MTKVIANCPLTPQSIVNQYIVLTLTVNVLVWGAEYFNNTKSCDGLLRSGYSYIIIITLSKIPPISDMHAHSETSNWFSPHSSSLIYTEAWPQNGLGHQLIPKYKSMPHIMMCFK